MPTLLRVNGFKIFFYANDHEPSHVHVLKGDGWAKIALGTQDVVYSTLKVRELKEAQAIIEQHKKEFQELGMLGFTGKSVHFDDTFLHVDLADGRRISTPLAWYPELEQASFKVLKNYRFICDGTGIEWEPIDYQLSIEMMLQPKQRVA